MIAPRSIGSSSLRSSVRACSAVTVALAGRARARWLSTRTTQQQQQQQQQEQQHPKRRRQRFVDISVPIENDVVSDPPPFQPVITYIDHEESFGQLSSFFPGLRREDLPDGEAWAVEKVELITHNGTHLDAPYHFHSTTDGERRKRSITIDEVPLEWCFGRGVKLDFRNFDDGYVATAHDVEEELERIEHTLRPLDIVLVNTRAGALFGTDGYVDSGCGMGREATLYLTERGVKVTGTDAWSWDAPFSYTAERYRAGGDPNIIWEGHKAGRMMEYCHLEKLHNLESLPSTGFTVCCFPVKIKAASAGWTRAVAIMDDDDE